MSKISIIILISIQIAVGFESGSKCRPNEIWQMNLISHPFDCRKFYSCQSGMWREEICPDGQQFDTLTSRCKKQIFEDCSFTKISLKKVLPAIDHKPGEKCYSSLKKPAFYPHPDDCGKYLQCILGHWLEAECSDGLYFSWFYNKCEWPEIAMCSLLNSNSSKFYVSSNSIRQSDLRQSLDTSTDSVCAEDEVKPHAGNCAKFFECVNGVWKEKLCPRGLAFNHDTLHCEWNAECGSTTYPDPEILSNHLDIPYCTSEFQPHEFDCQKFYQCGNGRWYEKSCPAGLHFSVRMNRCEWPEIAECQESDPPVTETCCSVPFKPNPVNCKSFYECKNNGNWILRNCPSGLEFNVETTRCEPADQAGCSTDVIPTPPTPSPKPLGMDLVCSPEGSLYPNNINCSMFQICSGGLLVDLTCPHNLFFDIQQKRCVEKSQAHCVVGL